MKSWLNLSWLPRSFSSCASSATSTSSLEEYVEQLQLDKRILPVAFEQQVPQEEDPLPPVTCCSFERTIYIAFSCNRHVQQKHVQRVRWSTRKSKNLVSGSCSVSSCPCLNIQTCNQRYKNHIFSRKHKFSLSFAKLSKALTVYKQRRAKSQPITVHLFSLQKQMIYSVYRNKCPSRWVYMQHWNWKDSKANMLKAWWLVKTWDLSHSWSPCPTQQAGKTWGIATSQWASKQLIIRQK